ncbi:hypothetical protein D9M69_574120 [compost metagenome]
MRDWTELKRLAGEATHGDWERDGSEVGPVWDQNASIAKCSKREDAAFIAVANPQAILALIAENERLRQAALCAVACGEISLEESVDLRTEVETLRTFAQQVERIVEVDMTVTYRDYVNGHYQPGDLHEDIEGLRSALAGVSKGGQGNG